MTTMDEARREAAERANRLQEEEHRGGYLKDGADMTPAEIEALGLRPHESEDTATRRDG